MRTDLAIKSIHYFIAFGGALLLTLILTPLVREFNRRIGMVDKPDPRRINTVPIPRGGGLALFLGVVVSYSLFVFFTGRPVLQGIGLAGPGGLLRLTLLASALVAVGYADDKFGLRPKVKLLGQIAVAFGTWWWADLGFVRLWPSLPAWLDCLITVFWITGAINAFNLIDGLDGLASGLAFIATLGMAGTLFIVRNPQAALFHLAFAGGLLGFLRYNYNPASVFLGDCGSMFIGYIVSVLPLVAQTPNSFLVSVGVPMLAMGVPIFDTALAILRRTIRHLIRRRDARATDNDKVMTADSDHLHHRILRSVGLNQRKAAWILYGMTLGAVAIGLVGMCLQSRTAGLWLGAVALGCIVVFRNMARIELYDAARLLNGLARDRTVTLRRRLARLSVPIYFTFDVVSLIGIFFFVLWKEGVTDTATSLRLGLLIRVTVMLAFLVLFRTYRTIWSRAMVSNYLRLLLACALGSAFGGLAVYYAPSIRPPALFGVTAAYAILSFLVLTATRLCRTVIRDLFYALDCSRMVARKDVSRILVYGAGLRYRAFRRELVRNASANSRIIVGLLDDDILIRGQRIGGIRVEGTLHDAREVINRLNADAVVIACVVSDEWMTVIRKTLAPTGVRLTRFSFAEEDV